MVYAKQDNEGGGPEESFPRIDLDYDDAVHGVTMGKSMHDNVVPVTWHHGRPALVVEALV